MADYHLLRSSDNGNSVEVVVHVPVPDENNVLGTPLKTCVVEDPQEPKVTQLPVGHLSTGEDASLADGSLVEYQFTFTMNADRSQADRKTALENRVGAVLTAGLGVLRKRYSVWGFEGSGT